MNKAWVNLESAIMAWLETAWALAFESFKEEMSEEEQQPMMRKVTEGEKEGG